MTGTPPRWCVLIPCLDEEATIRAVVESVLALGVPVIAVDDGSRDRTADILATLPITLLRHEHRHGKGQALRHGFREALRQGYDAVLTMDGDGQHVAADIPRLHAVAHAHPDTLVIGARLRHRERQPAARRRANAVADWGISWGCGRAVADTQSGQRWYPRAALALVDLPAQDFVFEAALLIAATRELGLDVISVPIDAHYPANSRPSHLRPIRDVTRIVLYTIGRVLHYGHIVDSYRRSRGVPSIVDDPAP